MTTNRIELVRARYGADQPQQLQWNDMIELLMKHRSVRAYRPDALPVGTLETLVAAAQSASTSSNMQSWSVVSVEHQARRDRLATLAGDQKYIGQCPLFLVFVADVSRHDRIAASTGRSLESIGFTETLLVAAVDAAIAAQNAVTAAESLGLSTVYIGAIRNDPRSVSRELNLPFRAVAMFGLCVGYKDEAVPAEIKPRLPQDVVLHREQYDVSDEGGKIENYDRIMHTFSQTYETAPYTWRQRVFARMSNLTYLQGRQHLRRALIDLGYPLE